MADAVKWLPPGFRCSWCGTVPATVRIFSGIYCGEGFPACDQHIQLAADAALKALADGRRLVAGYRVTAYRVDWTDPSHPVLGERLWVAKRRVGAGL